jgi:hypothetical protein
MTAQVSLDRRRYNREWARRRNERELADRQRTAATCPRRHGPGVCGGVLTTDTDRIGRTVIVCDRCERRKRGICRDCSRSVYGRVGTAIRCEAHAEMARQRQMRAYTVRHHDKVLARCRAANGDPEVRRAKAEYKRLWRKANPEKVRAQKKRYVERQAANPSSTYNRYHRRYRKHHEVYYRQIEKTKRTIARAGWRPPPCKECGKSTRWKPVPGQTGGRPWGTCNSCAFPFQVRERRRVRRSAARALANNPRFGLKAKPVNVRPPRSPALRGPGYERLCITPGCQTVLTHRSKKCTRCREREAEAARKVLARTQGRGRRVDLEEQAACYQLRRIRDGRAIDRRERSR